MITFLPLRLKFFRSFGTFDSVDTILDATRVFRPMQTDVVEGFTDAISHPHRSDANCVEDVWSFVNALTPRSLVVVFRPPYRNALVNSLVAALVDAGHTVWILENKRMMPRSPIGIAQAMKRKLKPHVLRMSTRRPFINRTRPTVHALLTNDVSSCPDAFACYAIQRVVAVRHMDVVHCHQYQVASNSLPCGVFIDSYFPFHPETKYAVNIDTREYFTQLHGALAQIVAHYSLSSLHFSRHPNSAGRELAYLEWEPISQFRTHELACGASHLFSVGSDASGLGAQLGIPAHTLVMPDVTPSAKVLHQREVAKAFGTGVIEFTKLKGLRVLQSGSGCSSRLRQASWRTFYGGRSPMASEVISSWKRASDYAGALR